MIEEAAALSAQHRDLDAILTGLGEEDWSRATRCPGWDVADVVLHLAQTDEMATASLQGRTAEFISGRVGAASASNVDDGAALMVERERGGPAAQLFARWRAAAQSVDEMFESENGHRRVVWVAGELSVRTLVATRLAEAWIHCGDIAGAVGAQLVSDDRLRHIARLAWRTLPYAFEREGRSLSGPVAFELTGPAEQKWAFGSDRQATTTVRGNAQDLCLVTARRLEPGNASLTADGPDRNSVLELVRTYA